MAKDVRQILQDFTGGLEILAGTICWVRITNLMLWI